MCVVHVFNFKPGYIYFVPSRKVPGSPPLVNNNSTTCKMYVITFVHMYITHASLSVKYLPGKCVHDVSTMTHVHL